MKIHLDKPFSSAYNRVHTDDLYRQICGKTMKETVEFLVNASASRGWCKPDASKRIIENHSQVAVRTEIGRMRRMLTVTGASYVSMQHRWYSEVCPSSFADGGLFGVTEEFCYVKCFSICETSKKLVCAGKGGKYGFRRPLKTPVLAF